MQNPAASDTAPHAPLHRASEWIQRWSHLVPASARVLDVACGSGRHMQWFAERGNAVTGIDRSAEALASAARFGEVVEADIEADSWPLDGREFDAVVVTNYLWRPIFPAILGSLAPGGVLMHETFAIGNESVGRPARAEFLLQAGELLKLCKGLRVLAYEDGFLDEPDRFVQRIVARREPSTATELFRARLGGPV
ncbi:class I SAM-dependent methyltransferase [Diaphorobacter aerolatus]|uniref:Methyltransferase domain-containing protein n=1 Tax=Diaphorobacter aerolatus TaxID=1288495 RepID=A0A7H0GII7_9BURK|nr:class I SAM-dependent methyltransferase [Diaphorobacter aerolatus]QNP48103.1 methyltransferase domain-containing protein [Diaphorobacter aerolatus]